MSILSFKVRATRQLFGIDMFAQQDKNLATIWLKDFLSSDNIFQNWFHQLVYDKTSGSKYAVHCSQEATIVAQWSAHKRRSGSRVATTDNKSSGQSEESGQFGNFVAHRAHNCFGT